MKKLGILAALFAAALSAGAQTSATQNAGAKPAAISAPNGTALRRPTDVLELKEASHNFGKIPQGRPATYTFEIVNTGSTPLLLDLTVSCHHHRN